MKALQPSDPPEVGRYRLLGWLGGGGMGQVFLGQSPGGRLVAVKLIRTELAADPGFRARFAREVAAARHVSGMFTAAVVDADPDGPQPWLVTAYVPGPSLADAVIKHGPLPIRSLLTLAAGLAEGLGVIHAGGMIHRDLKPSNVLLASDGPRKPRTVVLAYFAAINRHDWHRVWALGGKNLGRSYRGMVAGYRLTAHDDVTSLRVRGDTVYVHLLAHQTTGAAQSYRMRYVIHDGIITAGHALPPGTN